MHEGSALSVAFLNFDCHKSQGLINGECQKVIEKAVRWPCGVCGRGVGSNSIQCTSCQLMATTCQPHLQYRSNCSSGGTGIKGTFTYVMYVARTSPITSNNSGAISQMAYPNIIPAWLVGTAKQQDQSVTGCFPDMLTRHVREGKRISEQHLVGESSFSMTPSNRAVSLICNYSHKMHRSSVTGRKRVVKLNYP